MNLSSKFNKFFFSDCTIWEQVKVDSTNTYTYRSRLYSYVLRWFTWLGSSWVYNIASCSYNVAISSSISQPFPERKNFRKGLNGEEMQHTCPRLILRVVSVNVNGMKTKLLVAIYVLYECEPIVSSVWKKISNSVVYNTRVCFGEESC